MIIIEFFLGNGISVFLGGNSESEAQLYFPGSLAVDQNQRVDKGEGPRYAEGE